MGTVKDAGHRGQVHIDGGQAGLHVVFVAGGPGKVEVSLGFFFLGLFKGCLARPSPLLQHELIVEGDLRGQLGSNQAKPVADGFSPAVVPAEVRCLGDVVLHCLYIPVHVFLLAAAAMPELDAAIA